MIKQQSKKQGFTLVELLVVMAIIAILASLTIGIIGISQKKALVLKTTSAIHQIDGACKSYQRIFQNFPDLNHVDLSSIKDYEGNSVYPTYAGNKDVIDYTTDSPESMLEFNKRLRYFLEDLELTPNPTAPPQAQNPSEPLLQEKLAKKKISPGVEMYIDGWGNPLRVWWGRDHRGDRPKGLNNHSSPRYKTPLDIYSIGPNKQDEVFTSNPNPATDTATTTDFTSSNVDDIANWQGVKAK